MKTNTQVSIGPRASVDVRSQESQFGGVEAYAHFNHGDTQVSVRSHSDFATVQCLTYHQDDPISCTLFLSYEQIEQLREALNRIEVPA